MADARRMIAIAFGPATMADALAGLPRIREQADCVELRLDLFDEPYDLPALLEARGNLPVVLTLRPPDEGGKSTLPAAERLAVLRQAAELGAEFVDLEWNAASRDAIRSLKETRARIILSRHNFELMPAELATTWVDDLVVKGADVVKVVGAANDVRDCLTVFRAFCNADRPTIAIAMGERGMLSRVLALREDRCLLTYATLGDGRPTAPGQLTTTELREVYRAERLRPTTRVFGLLGPHAEMPRLEEYNRWFAEDGVDAVAVPALADADAPDIVSAFRELPVAGWHIHAEELQTSVGQALDELASSACRQGKINAVVARPDGGLVGHWVESPREQYERWLSG
jgi:3-dehydroquinate dehydratase/shikimate dehydrogenase